MKDQFIPYEQALKLKELGFNDKCFALYQGHDKILTQSYIVNRYSNSEYVDETSISAPLWQQAFDWLFQEFSVSLFLSNSLSYEDKVKILDNEIRNIQNNKS